MAPFMSALRMAMTSTRACNMNSLPTNRMRSLLAIWLEMASGSRNWDGFLIGNGCLTGKTWEKWSVPNVYHSKWSLQRICHTGWPGLKVTKGVGKAMARARKFREAVGTWKWMKAAGSFQIRHKEYTTDLPNLIIWPKVWKTSATLMIWFVLRTWWQVLAFFPVMLVY